MSYKTIFRVKPKKENKKEFCQRVVNWLNAIEFCSDGYVYNDGERMLNSMFKYSKFNNGYSNINDLLNEADKPYADIFQLCNMGNNNIDDEEILVNIDIISNCLYDFKKTEDRHFFSDRKAFETIEVMMKAINEFLLCNGYKLEYDNEKEQVFIIDSDIGIDIDEIDDKKIKSEIISYYDYRNANDIDEKKKIIVNLIGKLESRKNDISNIFGTKIADMFSNYANNFNLRHNNIDSKYKKYYNEKIAKLKYEDILKWWDCIFAFMINIYVNIDKLKEVNVNGGYK